ncbi:MAG: FG-GAP repeat domain-containing protein, partial [Burkholderiales bacterium]
MNGLIVSTCGRVSTTTPPSATLTSPNDAQQFVATNGLATIPIAGSVSTGGGAITLIEVLSNGSVIASYAGSALPAGASVSRPIGTHALQLRVTDALGATALSNTVNVTVSGEMSVTISNSDSDGITQANQGYTITWTSQNATSCVVDFSRNNETPFPRLGTPTTGTFLNGSFDAQTSLISQTVWRITCQGPGGPKSATTTHVTQPIGNAPTIVLTGSTSVAAAPTGPTTVQLTAVSADAESLTSVALFVDTSGGTDNNFVQVGAPVAISGKSNTRVFSYAAQSAGTYAFFARVTDSSGNVVQSQTVRVTVAPANIKGQISGIRTDSNNNPILYGYVCQVGNTEQLPFSVWAGERTAAAGGVLLATGQVANVNEELDDASVRAECQTPSASHHFRFNLAPFLSAHTGQQVFVVAMIGATEFNVACVSNNCIMPGTLRLGLTTPADNDRYPAPATVFMRARVTGAPPPYDVWFKIDNQAEIKGLPDSASATNDVFYGFNAWLSKKPTDASGNDVPYVITARTVKDGVTMSSAPVRIWVDAISTTATINLSQPAANATYSQDAPVFFSASVSLAPSGHTVRFLANGRVVPGTPVRNNSVWTLSWSGVPAGSYIVMAQLYDADGVMITQSLRRTIEVGLIGSVLDATPIPVVIDLPHVSEADAGTLPGALSVSKDGAANYAIDIDVPPGTAGLQPKLSINYNSQGTNGLLGLGWSLGGLSSIHRCGKTIAQDGVNERIAFETTDRLCLDGQRLVLVNQAVTDTAYWSDSAQYRTEIDSFTRIRAQGSGLAARSFIAETKDGRTLRYGNPSISPSSVVQAVVQPFVNQAGNAPATPDPKSGPMSWAVSEVLDRADNYMRFEYEQDMSTGEHRPKRIRYGGKNLPAHAAVGFTYTSRNDAWTRYVDGARNDLRSRLSSITTHVGANLDASAGAVVRTYKLSYERSESSGRSLLTSVEPCATHPNTGIESCLPRTTFDWGKPNQNQQPGFVSRGTWANGPILTTNGIFGGFSYSALHAEYFTFADLNNDGRTDLLEQRETSANLSVPDDRFMTAAVNDANPKGRGTYKNQYRYFHNTGAGFAGSTYSISTGEEFVVLGTGDFNGDGALDIVVETKVGSTLAQRICVSPLASSTAAPSSPITFTCGDPLPASLGISNFVDRLPFVVDALGNGLSSIYGPYNYGSFGEPLGATLCVVSNPAGVTRTSAPVMSCSLRADAPAGVLRPVERNVQFIENQRFDHISFEQMVDFSGTGKPNNVRWTKPYLTRFTDDGGTTVTSQWRWLNKQPMLVATDFAANMASTTNAIASYVYPAYDLPTRPNPFLAEFPYQFDVGKYGSNAADFNGSGYSSTAFGFIEYQSGRYNPNRTDFTVCISTGRALDCRVRKKYSGLDVTDGATTEPLLRYRQLRSIGQFEGDGAPTLLMERLSMGADQLKPIGTGRIQFCRLMGDDTTGGSGANDDNFSCRDASLPQEIFRGYLPEDINTTGRAFPVFFGDFLGTGRTQIMSYKG